MICSDFFELLDNYETLNERERSELENHTKECENCRKELEFFKSIISISASIPLPDAPTSLIDEVNAKLDSERAPIIGFRPSFRVLSTVAACLAIGLAVGINNSYIKENIDSNNTDGVITEAVVTTDEPEFLEKIVLQESEVPAKPEKDNSKVKKPDVVKETNAPVTNSAKPSDKPTKSPEKTPAVVKSTNVNVSDPTKKPVATPEATQNIENYSISEIQENSELGYYSVGSKGRTLNSFSDYLYVESQDMGLVVSTMSELGFKTADGYYMTSRKDFYTLIDVLNDNGVGYECDLKYNSGDEIAFKLNYN